MGDLCVEKRPSCSMWQAKAHRFIHEHMWHAYIHTYTRWRSNVAVLIAWEEGIHFIQRAAPRLLCAHFNRRTTATLVCDLSLLENDSFHCFYLFIDFFLNGIVTRLGLTTETDTSTIPCCVLKLEQVSLQVLELLDWNKASDVCSPSTRCRWHKPAPTTKRLWFAAQAAVPLWLTQTSEKLWAAISIWPRIQRTYDLIKRA